MKKKMKFNTRAIHGGQILDPAYGSVMTPIYQTSTYAQSSPGKHKGYEYSRTHNPTRTNFERAMASIENAEYGLAFASGLAAIDAIIKTLSPGDEIISTNDLYGGSYRLFMEIFEKYQLKFHFVNMEDLAFVEEKINSNTKLIWVETPTNPMMNVVDIKSMSFLEICAFSKALLAAKKAMSEVFSLSATKCRFFIPDLFEIHSSDVSTKFERVSFENLFFGK